MSARIVHPADEDDAPGAAWDRAQRRSWRGVAPPPPPPLQSRAETPLPGDVERTRTRGAAIAEDAAGTSALGDEHAISTHPAGIRLRLDGTFADANVEANFRERVRRSTLPRSVLVLCIAVGGLHAVHAAVGAYMDGMVRPATLIALSIAALFILMGAFALCARRCALSLAATEAVTTAGLCAHAALTPVMLVMLEDDPARGSSLSIWLVRELAVLTAVCLFLPLSLRAYTAVALLAFGGSAAALVVGEAPCSGEASRALGLVYFALVAASLVAGRARLARLERYHFHLQATVAHALAEQRTHQAAEVEAQLRLQTARAASNARSRLIRIVMHDLRSPLLSIRALAEALRDEAAEAAAPGAQPASSLDAPHVLEALEGLSTCASLMEYVVSDMLDYERIDSGRLNLVHAPFALAALLRSVSATFGAVAAEKQIRLEVAEPEGELGGCWLVGDLRRLQQCLNNGISNALKFTDAGGTVRVYAFEGDSEPTAEAVEDEAADAEAAAPPLRLQPSPPVLRQVSSSSACITNHHGVKLAAVVGEPVHIRVVDSGVGLDAAELGTLQRVREPFEQVGRGQLQGAGGTGLGLHICRQLLQLHQGSELRLHSDGHGHGTTFELVLHLPRHHRPTPTTSSAQLTRSGCASSASWTSTARSLPTAAHLTRPRHASSSSGASRAQPAAAGVGAHGASDWAELSEHEDADPPPLPPSATTAVDGHTCAMSARMRGRFHHSRQSSEFGQRSPGQQTRAPGRARELDEPRPAPNNAAEAPAALPPSGTPARPAHPSLEGAHAVRPARVQVGEEAAAPAAQPGPTCMPPREARTGEAGGAVAATEPAAPPSPAAAGPASGRTPPSTPHKLRFGVGFRCLYVDDDKILQRSLPLRTFKKLGAAYDVASDGAEAVAMVQQRQAEGAPYALIVMDNQMPRMTGTAATRELRTLGFSGTIIGMTGDPIGSPDRDEFDAAGLDACMNKDSPGIAHVLDVLRSFALDDDEEEQAAVEAAD